MTFDEMRNDGRGPGPHDVACEKCGRKMLAEKTQQLNKTILRYRACVCGHKVLTRQERSPEVIVREVRQHEDDEPSVLKVRMA